MATLKIALTMTACLALCGCGKLVGLNTPATPLAQIQVNVADDIASGPGADAGTSDQTPNLRVALVWGAQWQPEPFCFLPPESPAAAAVITAGCPDSFRFVPDREGADIPVTPGVPATITLTDLPGADVMVGDVTARIAYASLIVYDDRNGNGTLDLHHPPRHRRNSQPDVVEDAGVPATWDKVYGASFISMIQPDQRLAYREGSFDNSSNGLAFYPRYGCGEPLPAFSILSAGGFSAADAVTASLQHQLPEEAPPCIEATLDQAVVTIDRPDPTFLAQYPRALAELACVVNDAGGTTFYSRPPDSAPDLSISACVGFPHIPGDDVGVATGVQLVANAPSAACQSTNHYILRGCNGDPSCPVPTWDLTATPPTWWPCSP